MGGTNKRNFGAYRLCNDYVFLQIATGHLVKMWPAHYSKVTCLTFTGDDVHLVSGGEDGIVHVWTVSTILDQKKKFFRTYVVIFL